MNINNKLHFIRHFMAVITTLPLLFLSFSNANAADFCGDSFYINETLENGAKWDMCWEHRIREGIIFHHIRYTPKNGQRRLVLSHAAVAQIHVPYDDNGARYHDISDYGIGGNNMLSLGQDECPSGTLLQFSGKNVLCKQIKKRDFAYKSGSNSSPGNSLSLFSVSPVGAYYYIPTWKFMDDGTIEPWIGATGALQRFGSNQSRGWVIGDNRVGISHLHNFFWKLDFDLNATDKDDVVEELNFPLVNGKRQRTTTIFSTESSRKVNPDTMRRWRIRDSVTKNSNNHPISYDIVLSETGHQDIGPASEPFTHNDFYVTKQNDDEKFASHNPNGAKNLAEFVNGETITNNDVVIWAGVTFYHMPRSEDAPHMDAHWSHMQIIPRDWHAANPLAPAVIANTPPTINTPADQLSQTGTVTSLNIQATDVDGDTLSYTASGLPAGLSINSTTGRISGTPTSAVNGVVTVTVSDGQENNSAQFNWVVTTANTNHPPQITALSNRSGNVGDSINLDIQATDSDGDTISYSATGLPSGLGINSTTGVISGNLITAGTFSVEVKASDASANSTAQFSWSVTVPSGGVISNQVSNSAISVNGQLDDWSSLSYFANDPDDISGANNQIDWLKVAVAHSSQNFYLAYQNRQNIDPSNASGNYLPWGWQAYIDTDNSAATGFQVGDVGADYLIEGNIVSRYTGTGGTWSWQQVESGTARYNGQQAELSFSRASIGNPQNVRFIFDGDNSAFGGTSLDTYPDTGFLSYSFAGSNNTNSAPLAVSQPITVASALSVSVILTATDIDNDPLSFSITQQPIHGTLSGSAPNIVYTANSGYTGADSFKFVANDGTVNSQAATISITVSTGQNNGATSNYVSSPINIDGNNQDWNGLTHFLDDPNDVTGSIDWRNVAFAHDSQSLYMLYNSQNNIDPSSNSGSYLAWGWQVYIDSDKNSNTGFKAGAIGADYLIEGNQIQRYIGNGDTWSWQQSSSLQSKYSGKVAEILVPRSQIGNASSIRVIFQGDSSAYQGSSVDLYPDAQSNAQSNLRYFDYEFTGSSGSNSRPIAYAQTVYANTGASKSITLVATDPDSNSLTYTISANPLHGTLTGSAPNVFYKSDANFIGQDRFTFNVNDGTLDSATVTVTINVTGSSNGIISNLTSSIDIDGNNQEWSGLTAFPSDPNDVSGTNNTINWQKITIAHNSSQLYFLYQNHGAINLDENSGSYITWGWQAYIDADRLASTGYKIGDIGADYIIEGRELQRYTGNGDNWSWQNISTATLSYNANISELGFARSLIGNPNKFKVLFVGDSASYGGTTIDNYPDNLHAFLYQLSGGSQRPIFRPVTSDQTIRMSGRSQKIILSASDQDNDPLTFRVIEQPSSGTLIATNESGSELTYQKNDPNFSGTDSFRFVANDGTFDSSVNTINIITSTGNSGGESESSGGSLPFEALIFLGFVSLLRRKLLKFKSD